MTLTITSEHVKDGKYIGVNDVTAWQGSIEIAADLGTVSFASGLSATGSIAALAGSGIKAGGGIEAGLSVTCAAVLTTKYRVFAGLATWKATVTADESRVTCERFVGGTVAFGTLVETDKMMTA